MRLEPYARFDLLRLGNKLGYEALKEIATIQNRKRNFSRESLKCGYD
jgi:hypothetical protein